MDGRRRKTVHAARRPEERPKDASHSSTFTECTAAMLTLPSFAGPTSARSVTRTVRMRFSVGTGVWSKESATTCGVWSKWTCGVWSCKTHQNHRILWKTSAASRGQPRKPPRLALNGPRSRVLAWGWPHTGPGPRCGLLGASSRRYASGGTCWRRYSCRAPLPSRPSPSSNCQSSGSAGTGVTSLSSMVRVS